MQINFGSISNVGGKNVFLGSQSGLDIESLVKSLTEAKRLPAVKMEETITKNKAKITALNDLKSKLSTLKDKLEGLRNPTGFGTSATNIFDSRSAFMSMSNGDTASNYLGVTTANGAPIGSYEVGITRLATNDKYTTNITFENLSDSIVQAEGAADPDFFEPGNLVINGKNIALTEGMNLTNLISRINNTADIGVTASYIKIDATNYKLVLTAKETGNDNAITLDDTAVRPGVGTLFTHNTTGDLDAELEFNGETITRSSNTITDLLSNVTFVLYNETDTATIDLDIDKNSQTVATGIGDFLSSYNDIREFYSLQTERDEDGEYLETAVLQTNSTLRTSTERLASMLSTQVSGILNPYSDGSDEAPTNMGDLGILFTDVPATDDGETTTPEIKNVLDVDAATLTSRIDGYFSDVRKIFEFQFGADSGDLNVLERTNAVTTSEFTITLASGVATLTKIDGVTLTAPVALTVSGSDGRYTITGPAATDLEDLSFTYVGADGTITHTTSDLEKKFTLDIDRTRVGGQEARVSKLFGQTLSDPIVLEFDEGSSNATVSDATWVPTFSYDYSGDGTSVSSVTMGPAVSTEYTVVVDDTQAVGEQAWITHIDGKQLTTPVFLDYDSGTGVASGKAGSAIEGLSITTSGSGNETLNDTNTDIQKVFTLDIDRTRVGGQEAKATAIFGFDLVTDHVFTWTEGETSSSSIVGTDSFEGLEMLYTGDGTDLVNVGMTQGIADKMYNSLEEMLDDIDGLIEAEIASLEDSNEDLQTSVDRIDEQVTDYREQLLVKFSALEAAINSANQLLALLESQSDARNNG